MNRYRFIDENKKHLHTLDNKPLIGTTSCISETLQKGGLQWWASSMCAAEFGWLNPKKYPVRECRESAEQALDSIKGMQYPAYQKLLTKAYQAHNTRKENRAMEGTNLHALAEEYIKYIMGGKSPNREGNKIELLIPFIQWCEKNVKRFLFSEVHCYSERLWVGGIVDFGYVDMEGKYVLADIKSRNEVYFSDMVQLGAYDIQLIENGVYTKDGEHIHSFLPDKTTHFFIRHETFGLGDKFTAPVVSLDVEANRQAFEATVTLYKLKKTWEGK